MGGLFFDFEAVRTGSSDRDAPRRERVVSLVDLQADAVAAAGDTSRMRQVFIQMKNSAKASA